MILNKKIEEILSDEGELKNYKLCYIGLIPQEITKQFIKYLDDLYTHEKLYNPTVEDYIVEYNNPNYKIGSQTRYAYFTENMEDITGRGWNEINIDTINDSRYTDFSTVGWNTWGEPYDENKIILRIPFDLSGLPYTIVEFPQTTGLHITTMINPDINIEKKIPWINTHNMKTNEFTQIEAGVSPYEFVYLIGNILAQ